MASLVCEEAGAWPADPGLRSPTPAPFFADDSDADDASVSGSEADVEEEAARLTEALEAEAQSLPLTSYASDLQPAMGVEGRHALVLWVLAVRPPRRPLEQPRASLARRLVYSLLGAQASKRHHFAFRTSTLAVSLFDRFLSRYVIKVRRGGGLRPLTEAAWICC